LAQHWWSASHYGRQRRRIRYGRAFLCDLWVLHSRALPSCVSHCACRERIAVGRHWSRLALCPEPGVALGTFVFAISPIYSSWDPPMCSFRTWSRTGYMAAPHTRGVLGLGGLGALSAAAVTAQVGDRGRHPITFLYAAWTGATLLVAGYGLVTLRWQLRRSCSRWELSKRPELSCGRRSKQRLVPSDAWPSFEH